MTNQALEAAKAQIADAFRAERKERTHALAHGHRVKFLAEDGLYAYFDACKALEVNAQVVFDAVQWLIDDNARMNVTYGVETHHLSPSDYVLSGWMREQEEKKIIALPIARGENAKFLDAAE